MIVAANIGVVDEVELIDRHIRHLQALGVDRIVVTDTGSADGTAEILQAYADRGEIALLRRARDDPDAFGFANAMLEYTLDEIRPDWILFGDADEFHIPRTGSIRDVLAATDADLLQVERFNVPVSQAGPLWPADLSARGHDRLQLIVGQIDQFRRHLEENPDTPWIRGRILPKIVARADAVSAGIRMAGHTARPSAGREPVARVPTDLLIAHVPISGRARFDRKLANIREVFARFGDRYGPGEAWHWRRWIQLADAGHADEEYARQVFTDAALDRMRAAHEVMSAAEWFAAAAAKSTVR